MTTRLIFGCGYLGRRVAEAWLQQGDRVYAVTRSAERAAQWAGEGLSPIVGDVARPAETWRLPQADTVLYAVGYDRSSTASIEEAYAGGMSRILAAIAPETRRVIYVSTTGVYGGADGGVVDEQTPPAPTRAGGAASLQAERLLAASPFAARGVVLRMAGLYGPDRIPFVDKLLRGEPLPAAAEGWLNLIHIDDAARVVVQAAEWELHAGVDEAPLVLCVSDGRPVVRREYYREAARQLGTPEPQFTAPDPASPAAARAAASRRVSNARLQRRLSQALEFPDYRAGLAQAIASAAAVRGFVPPPQC